MNPDTGRPISKQAFYENVAPSLWEKNATLQHEALDRALHIIRNGTDDVAVRVIAVILRKFNEPVPPAVRSDDANTTLQKKISRYVDGPQLKLISNV